MDCTIPEKIESTLKQLYLKNKFRVLNGMGISILTTSKGVMSDKKAKKLNVGGEVLCQVW